METFVEAPVLPSAPNLQKHSSILGLGEKLPLKAKKTGTTIVGCICQTAGCVVLGADTRATSGNIIADKNCEKIHYIAPNIYCCGAGTAADTEHVTQLISSNLKLLRLNSDRETRVDTACVMLKRHLFPYMGYVSAALILGGVDFYGPHLYQIYPHGSTDSLQYVTMGSGSLAAMSVFETGYRPDLTLEECKTLVQRAICAGIFNDEGSGGNVDVVVVNRGGPQIFRNVLTPGKRAKPPVYPLPKRATDVLMQFIEVTEKPPPNFPAPVQEAEKTFE